jgi:hypothetical protein
MSAQPFPNVKDTQVVLLRNDLYTGIVKDNKMENAINETQEVWTVYDDLETAVSVAKLLVEEYDFMECMVFDKNKELLQHITPE